MLDTFRRFYTKSVCMRIGQRFNKSCINMQLTTGDIKWASEVKYLGLCIKSSQKNLIETHDKKAKFFRSSNAILNKLGKFRDNFSAMHLITSIAIPILTYGFEALFLTNSEIQSIDHAYSKPFLNFLYI